jgi:hypothetical protein
LEKVMLENYDKAKEHYLGKQPTRFGIGEKRAVHTEVSSNDVANIENIAP